MSGPAAELAGNRAEPLASARAAVEQAQADPSASLETALGILERGDIDAETAATASWAAGLASRELNRLDVADEHLTRAMSKATAAGLPELAARARSSRSLVLAYLGRTDDALLELALAEPHLSATEAARVQMQRGLILQRTGQLEEALDAYQRALPGLVAGGDRLAEVRLRVNRGVARTYRNELGAAEADLLRARALAAELGQPLQMAACAHNLAFLYSRRGHVPQALTWFDRAAGEYRPLAVDAGLAAVLLSDRAEVLLNAGLAAEACACAEQALAVLERSENRVEQAEARLLAARAALAAGRRDAAAAHAVAAGKAFTEQDRGAWSVLADYVAFVATTPTPRAEVVLALGCGAPAERQPGTPASDAVDAAEALARLLAEQGWAFEALSTRVLAGRLALVAGDRARAAQTLAAAAGERSRGSVPRRVEAWRSEVLRRLAIDDRAGARRAITAGLRVIEEYRTTLGASDLRAHVAALGDDLASLGVALALEGGRPAELLRAAEAWRAGSLVARVTPPANATLAGLLSELRALEADRRGGAAVDPRRRAALEDAIRDRARVVAVGGAAGAGPSRRPPATREARARLVELLGERVLVEWVECGGELHVVWLAGGRTRAARLGDAQTVLPEIESARMWLHRLARCAGSEASLALGRDTLAVAAARLATFLLGPVRHAGHRELVLVPTGVLHAVPWAALEPLRSAPFVVAPSARAWAAAVEEDRTARAPTTALLAAGPGLAGATQEVKAVSASWPRARVLTGDDASVANVLGSLADVDVLHVAAHGRLRTDNPLFSSVRLADGDLTVYDLESLQGVPSLVVLSACDTGANVVRAGDELLGIAAALLGLGAGTLVAPSVPVPDDATVELMVRFHSRLAAGDEPARALWTAACTGDDNHRDHAVRRSFVSLGGR